MTGNGKFVYVNEQGQLAVATNTDMDMDISLTDTFDMTVYDDGKVSFKQSRTNNFLKDPGDTLSPIETSTNEMFFERTLVGDSGEFLLKKSGGVHFWKIYDDNKVYADTETSKMNSATKFKFL